MIVSKILRKVLCYFSPWLLPQVDKGEKVIYLTFDDGPHPEVTQNILELLDRYNIKATFFLIGKNIETHSAVVQQLVKNGHVIGNHTYSHKVFDKLSKYEKYNEIEKCSSLISEYQHSKIKLFRPPCGLLGVKDLLFLFEKKYVPMLWNIDSMDFKKSKIEINKSVYELNNGPNIILFHDDDSLCVDLLSNLLPFWIDSGYQFKAPTI